MQPHPNRPRVVLDTDTFNEIDDQFALAHLLLSPETVDFEAVYAAPFLNRRSTSPADGMQKSYAEIQRILDLLGRAPAHGAFKGSDRFLDSADKPVDSPAARDLVERAMNGEGQLTVCAIGAPTNIASALLMEPRIADRIKIVWLGGHAPYWHTAREFNLMQDIHSSRVLMRGAAPLVQVPCVPVASHMLTSVHELEAQLAPFSKLGKYLSSIVRSYTDNPDGWTKEIWDLAATAYVVDPSSFETIRMPAPGITDDLRWSHDPAGAEITVVTRLKRDAIFRDFFSKARHSDQPA